MNIVNGIIEETKWIGKIAIEFPSQKALNVYLKQHPGANKSLHSVKKRETKSETEDLKNKIEEKKKELISKSKSRKILDHELPKEANVIPEKAQVHAKKAVTIIRQFSDPTILSDFTGEDGYEGYWRLTKWVRETFHPDMTTDARKEYTKQQCKKDLTRIGWDDKQGKMVTRNVPPQERKACVFLKNDKPLSDKDKKLFRSFREEQQNVLKKAGLVKDGKITVYRGIEIREKKINPPIEYIGSPADSWSFSRTIAKKFTGGNGIILKASIDVDRVIASYVGDIYNPKMDKGKLFSCGGAEKEVILDSTDLSPKSKTVVVTSSKHTVIDSNKIENLFWLKHEKSKRGRESWKTQKK